MFITTLIHSGRKKGQYTGGKKQQNLTWRTYMERSEIGLRDHPNMGHLEEMFLV